MSLCIQCKKKVDVEWDTGFIWVGCDGDLVCSQECHTTYQKDKDYFFDVVIKDDTLFANWLGVVDGQTKRNS